MSTQVKYLKCVTEPPLPPGYHLTFLYFGTDHDLTPDQITQMFPERGAHVTHPFVLEEAQYIMVGKDRDISALAYHEAGDRTPLAAIRAELYNKQTAEIQKLNYQQWLPHITLRTRYDTTPLPETLTVAGVVSNDDVSVRIQF